jgi:hypothetical protein
MGDHRSEGRLKGIPDQTPGKWIAESDAGRGFVHR